MSPVTHQTVKLSKGKHTGPNDGACVMELASMLADEPFSDHPASVCPTIGSFLRAYNDVIDEARRQDLYAYAARIVGSRSSEAVQRARAERLAAWTSSLRQRRWGRLLPGSWQAGGVRRAPPIDIVGAQAVRAISKHTEETHAAALRLLDELLAMGRGATVRPIPAIGVERPEDSLDALV